MTVLSRILVLLALAASERRDCTLRKPFSPIPLSTEGKILPASGSTYAALTILQALLASSVAIDGFLTCHIIHHLPTNSLPLALPQKDLNKLLRVRGYQVQLSGAYTTGQTS
jgi:hypothetical protein